MKGLHIADLLKNLSISYKKSVQPKGWMGFLNTLMELNIPLFSVSNPQARKQYCQLQMGGR